MNWLQCLLLLGFGFSWALVATTPTSPPSTAKSTKTELDWPDECKPGPKYWCQNLKSAKECKALDHCAQTVWMTQALTEVDESSACKTCVDYITGFQNITTSNITEKQMEIVLSAVCQLIPNYLLVKECVLVVKETCPELQKYIKLIDPHRFCSTIFLCNAATTSKEYFKAKNIEVLVPREIQPVTKKEVDTTSLAPTTEKQKKKLDCAGCYTLVTTGKKMFKKSSRDEVLNRMLEVCGELSSFSDLCSANIITYFPTIYHHLETMEVDDACHLSGVCDELYHFHEPTVGLQAAINNAPEQANDEVCDFCLAMVDHLKTIIIANSTELEFKQVLEGICKQTGNFKDQCLQLVDQYYELIYQFVINELDPEEVCQEVKLCVPKGISVEIKNEFPLWPVVPSTVDLDEALKNETSKPLITRVNLEKTDLDFSKPLTLVGASRCTWGPSYWCINMTTSKECSGTIKHCIQKVWETQELPADNGDICNICKDMVKQARDQLNSNETQEELREVFEGSCKLIPIKIAKKECIKAVDEFVPELVETLSSQMNPQIVCATVGLCNSARMDLLMKLAKTDKTMLEVDEIEPLPLDRMFPSLLTNEQQKQVEERGKEACEICELMLHFVQQQMTLPQSETEIKKVVTDVCVKLPHNVATQCSSFIEIYGDSFIALLAQEIDPSMVCPRIGACRSFLGSVDLEMTNSPINLDKSGKPETCSVCLKFMDNLVTILNNDRSEVSVQSGLNAVCSKAHPQWVLECKNVVDVHGENIIDASVAGFTGQETCYFVKMCSLPEIDGVDTNEVTVPALKDESISEVQGERCVLCEFIMSKLGTLLKDKKSAEEIKNGVLSVCDHMPVNVRSQCKSFCNQYADAIIGMLTYSWDADKVCSFIHVCHGTNKTEIENIDAPVITAETSDNAFNVEIPKIGDNLEVGDNRCVTCEFIMSKLEKELENNKTVEEIKKLVYTACDHMPKTIRPQCDDFVKKYADMVIDLLVLSMNPREVCTALHLCNKTVLESVIPSQQIVESNKTEWQQQYFIVYLCIVFVGGFLFTVLLIYVIVRARKRVISYPPYSRVTK